MENLLERIKAVPGNPGRKYKNITLTEEEVQEICLAWLKDEITLNQMTTITGLKGSNFYNAMAIGLRLAYRKGKIIEKK